MDPNEGGVCEFEGRIVRYVMIPNPDPTATLKGIRAYYFGDAAEIEVTPALEAVIRKDHQHQLDKLKEE